MPELDVKLPHIPAHARVRIWFWNNAGAQTHICRAIDASATRRALISMGATVFHTEYLFD